MNRRFNWTGRVRIPREKINIRLIEDESGGPPRFSADLSGIASLPLDKSGRIVVEPYVRESSMRFDFGTVGDIAVPSDTILKEIDQGSTIQFRVKVVDTLTKPGRLLATADQIRPADEEPDDGRKSILPVRYQDIGEMIWRLDVGKDESPTLVLNSRLPNITTLLYDDSVLSGAIFSQAVRGIMYVVLTDDVDTDQEWVKDWRTFGASLLGEELPEGSIDRDEASEIIDRIVEAFCERGRYTSIARRGHEAVEADYE